MKNNEDLSSRRKFISLGASSAAMLLGGAVIAQSAIGQTTIGETIGEGIINGTDDLLANGDVFTFDTVKSMRGDNALKLGDIAYTLGYHRAGDEGDNAYVIVGPMAGDDGGSILRLNNGLCAQGVFPGGKIRVEQFGAVGLAVSDRKTAFVDNTQAMVNAHSTGKVINYGAKHYYFSKLSIRGGGISGRGEETVLVSTDTSTQDIVTFQGANETVDKGATFKNFTLKIESNHQKSEGAGIKFNPLPKSLFESAAEHFSKESQFAVQVYNVKIQNIPTAIHMTHGAYYSIKDSFLSAYSEHGIYIDAIEGEGKREGEAGQSNNLENLRDSNIQNNIFDSQQPNAVAIAFHGGNVNVINNKIQGGKIGIELAPKQAQSMVQISGNTLQQQTQNSIRFATDKHSSTSPSSHGTGFSQVLISQNRLNADHTNGAAIYIAPTHFTLGDLSINNNLIRFLGGEDSIAAITINNCTRFMVNNNTINCQNGKGHRGLYISEDCNSGILSANHVILPLNGHTLNLSATTTVV